MSEQEGRRPSPPARSRETVRVDSVQEEYAFLSAHFGEPEQWEVISQTLTERDGAAADLFTVRTGEDRAAPATVTFDVSSFVGTPGLMRHGGLTTEHLDRLMRAAGEFARENPPAHPGSMARFPVPSVGYPGRVDIPLTILAVDGNRRGLYAPARVVAVDYQSGEPYGIKAFPGFDPDDWPPPRLGDWPPPGLAGVGRMRLPGMIARLSACVTRLLDAWFSQVDYPHLPDDAAEVRWLISHLDPPAMAGVYETLNPEYVRWIAEAAERVASE